MLKPFADKQVDQFCADTKDSLNQALAKAPSRRRSGAGVGTPSSDAAIPRHVSDLRTAMTDRDAFDLALGRLKAARSVKLSDVAEIARQYSLSVAAYKSKASAYTDIEKAFVRQARFENKLR
jgi:hypothetical protein